MVEYILEVMVSCLGKYLNLADNLTKNVKVGIMFVYKKVFGSVHPYKDSPRRADLVGSMYTFNVNRNNLKGTSCGIK